MSWRNESGVELATPGEAEGYLDAPSLAVVAVPPLATTMKGQCAPSALCRQRLEHTCLSDEVTSVKGT